MFDEGFAWGTHAYEKSLYLIEHGVVSGIRRVPPEDFTRSNYSQRWSPSLHGVDLNIRGLRSQGKTIFKVESILRTSCRMVCRNVQSFEIEEISLNFWTILDRVSHRHKDVFDSLTKKRDGMRVACREPTTRH